MGTDCKSALSGFVGYQRNSCGCPIVLPAVVVSVAGYMAVVGGVISEVSQMTVVDEILRNAQDDINKPRDGD